MEYVSEYHWDYVYIYVVNQWKVNWDYEIPNWTESHKIPWFQTTNQQ